MKIPLLLAWVVLAVSFALVSVVPISAGTTRSTLVFSLDQGFGNGVVVQRDLAAVKRAAKALEPLRSKFDVAVLLNPMVSDSAGFERVLDTLVSAKMPFVLDVYTSDGFTLGNCAEQCKPHDPSHGVTISIERLADYRKRYGKWLAGLRIMEVFAEDFTIRQAKTTNPEWLRPCEKAPSDSFFQPEIAERYISFARDNGMFVQWSDWHWFVFADWDAPQKEHEAKVTALLRKYPGVVTLTYANNEPNSDSEKRYPGWERFVAKIKAGGTARVGLSDQSWLSKDANTCPIDDIIRWARSALDKGCRYVQFEPAWYFLKLPSGTFDVQSYSSDSQWKDAGGATPNLTRLTEALMSYTPPDAPRAEGYRGIWYSMGPSDPDYGFKYSGGLGTYTANHVPLAIYAKKVDKTFFVYGGGRDSQNKELRMMVSYYDHKTGTLPKPAIVMVRNGSNDCHCNPVLSIDDDGFLYVFCPSHGGKEAFVYKSRKPYSIEGFDQVLEKEFSYPQVIHHSGFGFMMLFTKYTAGRELYCSTSKDGAEWTPDKKIAGFGGHYQVSGVTGNKRGTSCMWHPPVGGLDARTNLYYMESSDFGKTWTNAAGKVLETPVSEPKNDAMVRDYQAEGYLVYINDLAFDSKGRPIILYVISRGFAAGPKNGPRTWTIAHWTGAAWEYSKVTDSDNNYDMGSLYIEDDGTWRIIGPTDPGPQPWGTGGDVVLWTSNDEGKTWTEVRKVTANSEFDHTYIRKPINAHPDFYAFWADGDPDKNSDSRMYFCNKAGDKVWMLPEKIEGEFAKPMLVK